MSFQKSLSVLNRSAVFFFLVTLFVLNVVALRHKRLTSDEPRHYDYGMSILSMDSDRYDDSKMPFSALNAIPRKIWDGTRNIPILRSLFRTFEEIETGRYVTILFSLLLGFYIFRWAHELYGRVAALWALGFYTFAPNILAHSRLVTTDLYAAGMIFISCYYFWRYRRTRWGFCVGRDRVLFRLALELSGRRSV